MVNLLPLILAANVAAAAEAPKGDDVVAAAFAPAAKPAALAEPGISNVLPVAGVLIALAGATVFFSRRRRALPSSVRIIESASLGPKRTVTVVELMGERLALAVTESGVTVLSRGPVAFGAQSDLSLTRGPLRDPSASPKGEGSPWAESAFESELDDAELRAKLAAGIPGVIR